jgi:hypothetical protein
MNEPTPESEARKLEGLRRRSAKRRAHVKRLLAKHGYTTSDPLMTDIFIRGRITKKLYELIKTLEKY